ncbi:hypothetical protein AK812_SmicGene41741 [Symbiodinium microadriaticum]|uniref:Uncharacterized protein n=1 Tax=Symbiodinium microadriaticum TaxID=2951 RepID=A0A1Q9C5C8_SYMMI|nr:hypothetical protein AK812_SmicGene41741 [Symbiodinium microadriaticum]CAE7326509.1 unnamed protein product [Symbiodinium microadriaticum]
MFFLAHAPAALPRATRQRVCRAKVLAGSIWFGCSRLEKRESFIVVIGPELYSSCTLGDQKIAQLEHWCCTLSLEQRLSVAAVEEYQARMVEEERRRQMQERTVERMQTDFQHFIALIERAVLSEDRVEDAPNPAALLERLRAVASERLEITRPSRPDADEPLELDMASGCDVGLQVGECGDMA